MQFLARDLKGYAPEAGAGDATISKIPWVADPKGYPGANPNVRSKRLA